MALVNPPNWVLAFVTQRDNLTPPALQFLQRIVNVLNGSVTGTATFNTFGNGQSWYSGAGGPNGTVPGNIGDLYSNTTGGAGATLWVKESGAAGSDTGWVAK